MAITSMRFRLSISPEDYLAYYQGGVRSVVVRAVDGRRIEFPAAKLQPFIIHTGIRGLFEIAFDDHHRFVSLRRIAD